MKKLLGVCTFATVLLLSACSTNGTTICTEVNGNTIEATHEDGQITSLLITETEDISDYGDEEINFATAMLDAMPEASYTIDNDILTLTMKLEGEEIQEQIPGVTLNLDEFITNSEVNNGATCK